MKLHMRRLEKVTLLVLLAWLAVGSFADAADVKDAQPKRILVILDRAGLPWLNILSQSLQATLQSISPYPVDLHIEYTDQGRYPDDIYFQKLTELYRLKYVDSPNGLGRRRGG